MRLVLACLFMLTTVSGWTAPSVQPAARPAAATKPAVTQPAQQSVPAQPAVQAVAPVQQAAPTGSDPNVALLDLYKRATLIYRDKDYKTSKDILKGVAEKSTNSELSGNALYLLTDCYVRLGEYDNSIKSINLLTKNFPQSSIVKNGYVLKFAVNIIDRLTQIPTDWDYWRYQDGFDDQGKPFYKESVPKGKRITRINFKLAFGMYRSLQQSAPNSPEALEAKRKLETMLAQPITFMWVDEKAQLSRWGHPEDFFSKLSTKEKKYFSEVICERMFYDWKTDKFHEHLLMFDDVRNLKHHYTARGKEKGVFSLAKLFASAAYDPYTDTTANPTEANPGADLGL